jgi:Reverse transcriptase (RNA-dependent DNA polymerase)
MWLRSYLFDRKQFVRLGLSESSISRLLCGVPQGSVLGPLLFVLYTADLIHLTEQHGLHAHLYAVNTRVLESCLPCDVIRLQSCASWMRSNRLQRYVLDRLWSAHPHLYETRVSTLTPTYLVEPRSSKQQRLASQPCGIYVEYVAVYLQTFTSLWSCRWFLVSWTMATLCYVVYPNTSIVCSPLCSDIDLRFSVVRSCDTSSDRTALAECSRSGQLQGQHASLVYRCLHELAPPYLSATLHLVSQVESRRWLRSSADTDILLTPRSRLVTVGDRSFPVAGPRAWNDLPETVRASPSLSSFKRLLKTFLFSRRYS